MGSWETRPIKADVFFQGLVVVSLLLWEKGN